MSECKHEFKTVNASYTTVRVCGKCGDLESNIEINEIQPQIKELKSEINKIKEAFIKVNDFSTEQLKKERDELQMQVAVLRVALLNNRIKFCEKFDNRKNHSTICYPPWGNICEELENCEEIERILSTTTS